MVVVVEHHAARAYIASDRFGDFVLARSASSELGNSRQWPRRGGATGEEVAVTSPRSSPLLSCSLVGQRDEPGTSQDYFLLLPHPLPPSVSNLPGPSIPSRSPPPSFLFLLLHLLVALAESRFEFLRLTVRGNAIAPAEGSQGKVTQGRSRGRKS